MRIPTAKRFRLDVFGVQCPRCDHLLPTPSGTFQWEAKDFEQQSGTADCKGCGQTLWITGPRPKKGNAKL